MKNKKSLLVGEIHRNANKLLKESTHLTKITNEELEKTDLFPEHEILVVRTFTKVGAKELQKLPDLKYIVSCSVGIDNIDIEEINNRKIELIHCQGTNANSVAEHTIFLLFSLLRNTTPPFSELKNKTIGIIGFGNIGKLVAKKLSGFESKIIAFDIIEQDKKILEELKVEMKPLEDVIKLSDIITIHVPLNPHTKDLINEKLLLIMKPNSFIINTSRAEIIEEDALIRYYQQGKFKGIALDVYSENLKNQLKESNTILTSHTAAQGEDSYEEMCVKPIVELLKKIQ